MKVSTILKQFFVGACVYYTLASVVLLLLNIILDGGNLERMIGLTNFLLLFPFGLALSGAGMIYRHTSMPRWSRLLLHYLITLLAFLFFLWLPSRAATTPTAIMTALFLLSLLYWAIYLIAVLSRKRFQSFREE